MTGLDYFIVSKARARTAMKSSFLSPAGRMYLCLSLATRRGSDLAVKVKGSEVVPLTPGDVCQAIGIHRSHFRRYFAQIEAAGLAECRGKSKGHVEIYSWAAPRARKEKSAVA